MKERITPKKYLFANGIVACDSFGAVWLSVRVSVSESESGKGEQNQESGSWALAHMNKEQKVDLMSTHRLKKIMSTCFIFR